MRLRLASVLVVVLGTAVFAGSAFAGNGNGNGHENSDPPGNSGNAPGQVKKDAVAASSAGDPAPPQADVAAPAEQTSSNATGVKPSNSTAHETHAPASSDRTKEYGNGQTAGEIAVKNGAKPSAILHGPGNSQPHKTAPCSGGHEVDVHALKAKGQQKKCGVAAASKPATSHVTSNVTPTHAAAVSAAGAGPTGQGTTAQGGVLGSIQAAPGAQHAGGVLGAIEAAGGGVLPFTGYPLGIALLVALGLIGVALLIYRRRS